MHALRLAVLTVALLVVAAVNGHAQTTAACDGPIDPLFVLPPDATGAEYGFRYEPENHAGVTQYTLRIYDADAAATAPALSTQVVMKAAVSSLGASINQPAQHCYQLPIVPVAQIPRGRRLVMTVQAQGAISELSALESGRGDPFGLRLTSTGAPQRKPGT